MELKLNGQFIATHSKNLLELLKEYKIEQKSVAIAVNLEVIKQDQWESYMLKNGDVIECFTFLGGG
ncbi:MULTISPECIES: sulfur carrier protein ThiS [Helicobacter]|uniref:sulfur carrier protein ThiS n=1 Tax=Helicobacter TaxID=209 RepID=UPI000DCE02EB|nr:MULTISPECIES: sulfur carrier protein ThiS [Helicobacter]MCI2236159.1 sulfur carrier protein ThiS [Helicobacter sp. CaF467b]MCI7046614.1 sulfur carrier protein ThiS [Helicobacter sp.]MCI7765758.1 sulfur carrier protein ThiS [Helicobacter sp.]MCL9820357.1 sulfur carrier protein ThiS [Helicobacter colisuis]MCL9822383.1 sulfur carrier protein ThiS [Helicobacter colisuis]